MQAASGYRTQAQSSRKSSKPARRVSARKFTWLSSSELSRRCPSESTETHPSTGSRASETSPCVRAPLALQPSARMRRLFRQAPTCRNFRLPSRSISKQFPIRPTVPKDKKSLSVGKYGGVHESFMTCPCQRAPGPFAAIGIHEHGVCVCRELSQANWHSVLPPGPGWATSGALPTSQAKYVGPLRG